MFTKTCETSSNMAKQGYEFTHKQRAFIAAYDGNAYDAARKAGYSEKSIKAAALSCMRNVHIMKAIRKREHKNLHPLITSIEARLKWLIEQITNSEYGIKDRLKAYELLAKTKGDFLDVNINQSITGTNQPAPTIIVIKAGKDAQTQINLPGSLQDGQAGDQDALPSGNVLDVTPEPERDGGANEETTDGASG